jgi:hypothetical protein
MDALRSIGILPEQINSVLNTEEWIIEKNYCVFGKDFETSMRASFLDYEEVEQRAKAITGDSKPLIARYVAKNIVKNDDKGWQSFERLRTQVQELNIETSQFEGNLL